MHGDIHELLKSSSVFVATSCDISAHAGFMPSEM